MAEELSRDVQYVLENGSVSGRTAAVMRQGAAAKIQIDLGLAVHKVLDDLVHIPKNRVTAEAQLHAGELVETWCGNVWQPANFDPEKVTDGWEQLKCCLYCLSLRFGKSVGAFAGVGRQKETSEGAWQLRWYNSETGQVL